MRAMRWTLLGLLVLVLGISACRPRGTRSRARTPAPAASSQTGPTYQSVLQRTDSAMARVSALGTEGEVEAVPEATETEPPRTPWGAPYVPRPDLTAYGVFQAGLASFNGKDYPDAIAHFSQVVASGRPAELVPNAYYWMGESFYAMQQYQEAIPYFEYVTRVGPQYKREISMYKLARANEHLGNRQGANLWYERLRSDYPKSGYIRTLRRLGLR